jgi:2-amino-4-hydroxy-6-hydroxymethyldihydropteridine diphosphokinase
MPFVYLGLGSNLGDRYKNLVDAIEQINKSIGEIMASSPVYETDPWGFNSCNYFLNQVISLETFLEPGQILGGIRAIEKRMGRKKTAGKFEDRNIDIDVLFYDDLVLSSEELKIPHPHLHERSFVLQPMFDLDKKKIHQVFHKSIAELLAECADQTKIKLYHPLKKAKANP